VIVVVFRNVTLASMPPKVAAIALCFCPTPPMKTEGNGG
jgi:hypothetical protein